ncbi:hypothetical protein KP509_28G059900 [Ceratopteris richardii]|uniref:Pentatricopeptide repeat-containing protein n=1 Tax=Ceratopteris richardii TaxID=49495 RepID=A0A8T2RCL2_CERRI|nr:hypothetical protein KP509_28G059900 [Ceratopteris richardii]KAH7294188.1 hypothetical protein KP509_28G059900 [Ceratopteris richardii]
MAACSRGQNDYRRRFTKNIQSFGSFEDWKAVCEGRKLDDGLQATISNLQGGKPLSREIAYCLLQGCSKNKDIAAGKLVLSFIHRSELPLVAALGDPLIRLFAAHGQLTAAYEVFVSIEKPGSHSWYAIISAHVLHREYKRALILYNVMLDYGILTSKFMFSCLLKACTSIEALEQGMLLHDQIVESSLETEVVMGSVLIGLYSKCGCLQEAHSVFIHLKSRNVVSFNTLMSGYVQHGEHLQAWELFEKMQRDGIVPDHFTLSCILKACRSTESMNKGVFVHNMISLQGLGSDVVIGNALIDMYFKCGNAVMAQQVFNDMPKKDIVSWNTLFMGYNSTGYDFDILIIFMEMQDHINPSSVTYLSIIKACSNTSAIAEGRWIHDKVIRSGQAFDIDVGSALVYMYAHCGNLFEAQCIFDNLFNKDDVLWCTMIAAYADGGCSFQALELYERMQEDNMTPDSATFLCILKACTSLKFVSHGKLVHEHILSSGLGYNAAIRNTLINMYMKCGKLDEAEKLFIDFPNKNLVSWNAMMTGYFHNELGFPALKLFEKLLSENLKPDKISYISVLKATACSGAALQGRLIDDILQREVLELDIELGISLADMYAKCGSLDEACKVFELVRERKVSSWGTLLSRNQQKSNSSPGNQDADFKQNQDFRPSSWIYTSVLSACSQAGELEEACRQFKLIDNDCSSMPSLEHYNCIIDNFGRTGCVYEAEKLLQTMPIAPDIFGWMSLLTACKIYGYPQLAKECCAKIVQLKHDISDTEASFVEMGAPTQTFSIQN